MWTCLSANGPSVTPSASFDELIACSQDDRSRALAHSTALQYWLGLRMVEEGAPCPVCQRVADPYGDHQIGCGGNGDRIHRHDSIRDAVFSAAQSAALAPRREVPALVPASSSRPADIYLPTWKRGQPAALDVTVISTLQSLTLSGAASTPGHALSVAAERKRTAHATACHSVGITFIPLVVESLGGWGPEAISTLKDIGRLQGQRLGTPPSLATRHLFQRLAIRLWRGNATLWIGRLPIHSSEVDGVQ